MEHADVIVVGAGLSGLACAHELQRAGRRPLVLDASDRVGGRLRTDRVDGFLLDRGFQVLLDSYSEAREQLDLEALRLRRFEPGAVVRRDGRFHTMSDPRRRPIAALGSAFGGVGSVADKLRVLRLERRLARGDLRGSAADLLDAQGFGPSMLEGFLRPFLAGVFLERGLVTSAEQLAFVWDSFRRGSACLPAGGMQAIPEQLAARLPPETLRLGARVESVGGGAVHVDGARLEADTVVLATEEPAARRLLDAPAGHPGRSVTCLHFAADEPPQRGPWLVLDGDGDGPVNNLCVTSEVAPEYAPPGRAAVSVTVLGKPSEGDLDLAHAVRAQLRGWYGAAVDDWELLRVDRVRAALPVAADDGQALRAAASARGVELCGDHGHAAGASIQSALGSGRRLGKRLAQLTAAR